MSDLAGHHFLLHPSVTDPYACLEHSSAHKSASTSALIVLPMQPGMWHKYLPHAQSLKDVPCSEALFAPPGHEHVLQHASQVYFDAPVVTDSVCAAIGTLGLTTYFHGTVPTAPASIWLDSGCSHSWMSAAYARRVGVTVKPPQQGALQVAAANGLVCSSIVTCKVCLVQGRSQDQ